MAKVFPAEYRRLKQQDRQALFVWELSEGELRGIAEAQPPPEAAAFDHEFLSLTERPKG